MRSHNLYASISICPKSGSGILLLDAKDGVIAIDNPKKDSFANTIINKAK